MQKRFLADAMLKNVWRWLCLLGVDCEFELGFKEDDELIKKCLREKRVLLTRDAQLYGKAKNYVRCLLLPAASVEEQVAFVTKEFSLRLPPLLKKCPKCGGKIVAVKKTAIKEKVFSRVYASHRDFWRCRKCRQIFWKGSHWPSIRKSAEKIRRIVAV